jgi:hypothetical protein
MPTQTRKKKRSKPPQRNQYGYDPKKGREIAEYVKQGLSFRRAVAAAHVKAGTADEWLRRGRGQDERPATPDLENFVALIEAAKSGFESTWIDVLRQVGLYSEQDANRLAAARFMLTHGPSRSDWKPESKTELEVSGGDQPVNIVLHFPTSLNSDDV